MLGFIGRFAGLAIPSWGIWAMVALVFAGTWTHGYVKGLHHQEAIDEQKFAQIRVTQDEQALKAGRLALDRSVAIGSIVDTYEAQRRALDAVYARRLRDAAASHRAGTLPADSLPQGTDAGLPDGLSACPARYAELEGKCADTALMYRKLREAARAVESIH